MLSRRVAVAVIGIPIMVGLVYLGKLPFSFAIGIVIFLSLVEFYRLAAEIGIKANLALGLFFGSAMPLIALFYGTAGILTWLLMAVLAGLLWKIFSERATMTTLGLTLLGIFYIGLFLSYLIMIDKLPAGKALVVYTFIATWVADTAAYGMGRLIGRHPLAAGISPNKTIEGLAGAVIINVALFASLRWMPIFSLWQRILFALVITIVATFGDLAESAFKREVGVKDSGNLIPGHGGFFDRFDSMIFTGVAAFFLIRLFS